MKIVGVDPNSRQGTVLKNELRKIGFRLNELEFTDDCSQDGWHLLFGSPALREIYPDLRMSDVSGQLLDHPDNPDSFIIPTYAPGFLYHNPNMKGLWKDQLETAYATYTLNEKGVIV